MLLYINVKLVRVHTEISEETVASFFRIYPENGAGRFYKALVIPNYTTSEFIRPKYYHSHIT